MNEPQFVYDEEEDSSQHQPSVIFPNQMELQHEPSSPSETSSPSHHLQYEKPSLNHPVTKGEHKSRKYSSITNQVDFSTNQPHFQNRNSELQIHVVPKQRKRSTTYEQKVDLFLLQKGSQMKRNIFAQQQNLSPTHGKKQAFSLKPQHQQQGFEPNNQQERTQQLRNDKIRQTHKTKVEDHKVMQDNDSSNIALALAHQSLQHITNITNKRLKPISNRSVFEFIRQNSCGSYCHPIYTIKTKEEQVILSARKQPFHFNSHYNITHGTTQKVEGKLKGNFGGTEFNLLRIDNGVEDLVATIIYETICSCNSSYRKIEVYFTPNKSNDLMFKKETQSKNLKQLFQYGYDGISKLITKQPTWNEQGKFYSLPFGGKAKLPSIKNMILIDEKQPHKNAIIFCKTAINNFHLQVEHGMSLLVVVGILMSSFDFKLLCQ